MITQIKFTPPQKSVINLLFIYNLKIQPILKPLIQRIMGISEYQKSINFHPRIISMESHTPLFHKLVQDKTI